METLRLKDNAEGIKQAAEILKNGGVVAIPTETVYGLAASAYNEEAVNKIFIAKGRPQDNPLIVHVCDLDMATQLVENFTKDASALAEKFWPGPLTMILNRDSKIPSIVSAGLETLAIRMPKNKVARELIRVSGLPLAAPSANTSGAPSPTSAEHVLADLDGKIDAIIMSRDCNVGVESTVVSLAKEPYNLLRPGAVTAEQLKKFLPDMIIDKAILSELKSEEKVASPGMKYKHYSPKTKVFLVEGESSDFCDYVNQKQKSLALCFDEEKDKIKIHTLSYGKQSDDKEKAKQLFAILRRVDQMNVDAVYVHAPKQEGIGLAVYNRLIRAAAFKVISL